MSTDTPELVSFITIDDEGTDLLVAFALESEDPDEVTSVILMRAPEQERLLPDAERGVRVSHELDPETEDDYLVRLRMTRDRVEIETTGRAYVLDISRADPEELRGARELLRRMNFDNGFELDLGEADDRPE